MLPALQGTITLWTVGSKPINLPLGIINFEVGDWKTACKSTKYIENEVISDCQLTSGMELKMLSCQFLNHLKTDKLVDLVIQIY